jgi:glycosyltransferase involved in cell wall biosynthesis
MRIAILGPYPYPPDRGRLLGGVEAVVVYLSEALRRYYGAEIHVITLDQRAARYQRFERPDGATVHLLPRARLGHILHYAQDIPRLCQLLRALRPDIAHAQGASVYIGAVQQVPEIPSVITLHGVLKREAKFSDGLWSWLQWQRRTQYEALVCTRHPQVIVCNPYITEEFGAQLRGHCYPLENPVDEAFFSVTTPASSRIAVMPGRIIKRKGILDLIEAWSQVARAVPNAHLRLCGEIESEPVYVQQVRDRVAALGLTESVSFQGECTRDDMVNHFAAAGLITLASYQETSPVAISEAFAAGRPVIATRAGGVAHMIADGQTGYHLAPGDHQTLATRLITLLSDDQARQQMGAAAQAQAQHRFHPRAVAAQTMTIYQQIIATHQQARLPVA